MFDGKVPRWEVVVAHEIIATKTEASKRKHPAKQEVMLDMLVIVHWKCVHIGAKKLEQ